MRLLISFTALFFSAFLIQMGSGSLGPLDALSGSAMGWSATEIGLLGSAHFAGFFIGCWGMPRLIGSVGHSRAFAVAAAIGTVGVILHPLLQGPLVWAGLRVLTGMAIAGGYTAIESWLQAKIDRTNRGRIFGAYRVVDMVGGICAQSMIAFLEPASYVSYNIVALFCIICLLPLALTRRAAPVYDHAPTLQPRRAFAISPLACLGIMVAGATGASFRMVGPVFGVEAGLDNAQIAVFLVSAVVGAALAQYPVGWLADKMDRRHVLIGLSAVAVLVCLVVIFGIVGLGAPALYVAAALFGATSFTIYSVSAAHANDFCPDDFIVELNAALIFFFSVGAIVSPLVSSALIGWAGAEGLWAFIAMAHVVLIVYSLYRMTRRATMILSPYRYLPRTSMVLARLWEREGDAPGTVETVAEVVNEVEIREDKP